MRMRRKPKQPRGRNNNTSTYQFLLAGKGNDKLAHKRLCQQTNCSNGNDVQPSANTLEMCIFFLILFLHQGNQMQSVSEDANGTLEKYICASQQMHSKLHFRHILVSDYHYSMCEIYVRKTSYLTVQFSMLSNSNSNSSRNNRARSRERGLQDMQFYMFF